MFKKLFGLMVLMVALVIGVNCSAMKLTNDADVYTGMSYEKVAQEIQLEHFNTSRGLTLYHRVDSAAYYAFNSRTNELIYKLVMYKAERFDSMYQKLTSSFGSPVKLESSNGYTYFWRKSREKGYKLSYVNEKIIQLWYGSVPLWNDFCDQEPGMRPFPN